MIIIKFITLLSNLNYFINIVIKNALSKRITYISFISDIWFCINLIFTQLILQIYHTNAFANKLTSISNKQKEIPFIIFISKYIIIHRNFFFSFLFCLRVILRGPFLHQIDIFFKFFHQIKLDFRNNIRIILIFILCPLTAFQKLILFLLNAK
jgi:hypothetical protein